MLKNRIKIIASFDYATIEKEVNEFLDKIPFEDFVDLEYFAMEDSPDVVVITLIQDEKTNKKARKQNAEKERNKKAKQKQRTKQETRQKAGNKAKPKTKEHTKPKQKAGKSKKSKR